MKKGSALFFQTITTLIGISILVLMLWEPHLEGRNVNATVFEIYFRDPFLAYAYAVSILFFVALYKMYKVFGYVGENNVVSLEAVSALRTIKKCTFAFATTILAALVYLFITMRGKDDIAGGVAMGLFIITVSIIIGITASVFEKRSAVQLKSR